MASVIVGGVDDHQTGLSTDGHVSLLVLFQGKAGPVPRQAQRFTGRAFAEVLGPPILAGIASLHVRPCVMSRADID